MNMRRIEGAAASLLAAGTMCAACSSSMTAKGTPTIHTASVSRCWKTYSYDDAKISVPSTWDVIRDAACPKIVKRGTLLLGLPMHTFDCALSDYTINFVAVTSMPPDDMYGPECQADVIVNRLPASESCNTSGSLGTIFLQVPSLRIEAAGSGPDANLVLDTLRRA